MCTLNLIDMTWKYSQWISKAGSVFQDEDQYQWWICTQQLIAFPLQHQVHLIAVITKLIKISLIGIVKLVQIYTEPNRAMVNYFG